MQLLPVNPLQKKVLESFEARLFFSPDAPHMLQIGSTRDEDGSITASIPVNPLKELSNRTVRRGVYRLNQRRQQLSREVA